jgi:hypothetical protein
VPPPEALRELVRRFDPDVFDAPDGDARLRLGVRDVGEWDVVVSEGAARLQEEPDASREPHATLTATQATWKRVAADVAAGMDAYRRGALDLRRNLHLGVGFLAATSGATDPGRLRFHTVRSRGTRFSVLEAGEGEPLVMLHGLGGTKVSMLPIVAALAPQGYRMVAADLPGFGDSGKPLGAAYDPPFFSRSVAALLDGLGLAGDETLPDRTDPRQWPALRERFTEAFASRTRAEWWQVFEGTDACVAPVWSLLEATQDAHNVERGVFVEVDGVVQPDVAPRFSVTPGSVGRVPAVGEHSAEIRAQLGLG